MLSTSISRLRLVSFVEGLSYLVLVFVAMPMKYVWGNPEPVRIFGMAHGVLFVVFCVALLLVLKAEKLDVRGAAIVFLLSLVPLGFLPIESRLKRLSASEA